MILLDENQYDAAIPPLSKVPFNHLFARSVIERHVKGRVYADDAAQPTVFHVVHPYGLSLLFGSQGNESFLRAFVAYAMNENGARYAPEWLQIHQDTLLRAIEEKLNGRFIKPDALAEPAGGAGGGLVAKYTRVNFAFDVHRFRAARPKAQNVDWEIVRTDAALFDAAKGAVVPKNFWNNAQEFLEKGAGYSVLFDGEPVSTAYTAFVHPPFVEIGIETDPGHRRKGFALAASAALIDHILELGCEPVWACRLDNVGSYRSAQKIGFKPVRQIPFFRLPV